MTKQPMGQRRNIMKLEAAFLDELKAQHTKSSFTKVVLRDKCIAVNTYIKNQERSQINNLNFNLKKLEK